MRLALSEISTPHTSFEEDVIAYAAAGFDGIGIWEHKLPDDDQANVALLAEHGLGVAICVPVIPSFLPLVIPGMEGPADPAERVEAICMSIRRLAQYRTRRDRLPDRAARRPLRGRRATPRRRRPRPCCSGGARG